MSTVKGAIWRGNYGAHGRWLGKIGMCQQVTDKTSLADLDREFMNYVHSHRIRHDQLNASYHRTPPSSRRKQTDGQYFRWRREQYIRRAAAVFIQFETMKTLKEQATLVNQYGQAAVNYALGDNNATGKAKTSRMGHIARRIRAPVMQRPVVKHIATRRQQLPARFDRAYVVAG